MTDENTTLIALTVTATAREGGQSVTVSEPVTGNDLRRYKITDADKKPEVEYDAACVLADGWADLPSNGEITGAADQVVTVVELTNQGANARGKGEAVLPAPLDAAGDPATTVTDGVLDLLPDGDTIMAEVLRLGLVFDHSDDKTQTWCDYQNGVTAAFELGTAAKTIRITDMDTRLGREVTLGELKKITSIRTWRNRDHEEEKA